MSTSRDFEVLRGMNIEAVPLRLSRGRAAGSSAGDGDAGSELPGQDEALRRGYEAALQQGRSEGFRAGHDEGWRRGEADASADVEKRLEKAISDARRPLLEERARLRALGVSIEASAGEYRQALEEDLLALCYEVVCRVLGTAAVQPDAVKAQVEHTLRRFKPEHAACLHLHPQDAELLGGIESPQSANEVSRVRWVADAEVVLGGCIVVARGGGLDARMETILTRCKDAILQARARRALPTETSS